MIWWPIATWAWALLGETVANDSLGFELLGDMVANCGLSKPIAEKEMWETERKMLRERERETNRQKVEREFINLKLDHFATVTSYK